MNAASGSKQGASDEKIVALGAYQDSSLFTPAEKVALALADAMTTQLPVAVPEALYQAARSHFGEPGLVELAATIALENFRSRFNRCFQVEAHGFYCPVAAR